MLGRPAAAERTFGTTRLQRQAAALQTRRRRALPPARSSRCVGGAAQVRQSAEVAHELDEWEVVHVEDGEGEAAYTRRRTVFGKISCAPGGLLSPAPVARPCVRQELVRPGVSLLPAPLARPCVWQVSCAPSSHCSQRRSPGLVFGKSRASRRAAARAAGRPACAAAACSRRPHELLEQPVTERSCDKPGWPG